MMATWRDAHPDWEYTLIDSEKVRPDGKPWRMAPQIARIEEWNGKADLLRMEWILERGGFVMDADSICLHPLPDSILEYEAVACWENERHLPGMIATGYLGARAGSPLMADVLDTIEKRSAAGNWHREAAWRIVGPLIFTEVARRHPELHVMPAAAFIPRHYSGVDPAPYDGPVYADQKWGSTIVSPHYKYRGLT
jgi:mannosyltransferase OCH1-like enzyme